MTRTSRDSRPASSQPSVQCADESGSGRADQSTQKGEKPSPCGSDVGGCSSDDTASYHAIWESLTPAQIGEAISRIALDIAAATRGTEHYNDDADKRASALCFHNGAVQHRIQCLLEAADRLAQAKTAADRRFARDCYADARTALAAELTGGRDSATAWQQENEQRRAVAAAGKAGGL